MSLRDHPWHWRTAGANLLPITAPSVKGSLFSSLSQGKFPARTNCGLHSSDNTELLAFYAFLHVLALVGEAAPLPGVWVSLQVCVIYNGPDQHLLKDIPLHKCSRWCYRLSSGLCTAVATHVQAPDNRKTNLRGGKGKVQLLALSIASLFSKGN